MIGEHLLGATPFALAAKFAEADMMRALLAVGRRWRVAPAQRLDPAHAGVRRELAVRRLGPSRADAAPRLRVPGGARRRGRNARRGAAWPSTPGGDANAVDETGSTALHYVADKGFPRVIELLVEHGAGLNVANYRGQTPLAVVRRGPRQSRGRGPSDRGVAARAGRRGQTWAGRGRSGPDAVAWSIRRGRPQFDGRRLGPMKRLDRISIDPTVRFGKPRIRGTRITVGDVLEYLAGGTSEDQTPGAIPSTVS